MNKLSTSQEASGTLGNKEIGALVINPIEHITTLNSWLVSYGLSTVSAEELPQYGVAVSVDGDVKAMSMLYQMEGNRCFMEGAAISPKTPKKIRNEVLDTGLIALEELARMLGYKVCEVLLDKKTLKDRFAKHGYTMEKELSLYKRVL